MEEPVNQFFVFALFVGMTAAAVGAQVPVPTGPRQIGISYIKKESVGTNLPDQDMRLRFSVHARGGDLFIEGFVGALGGTAPQNTWNSVYMAEEQQEKGGALSYAPFGERGVLRDSTWKVDSKSPRVLKDGTDATFVVFATTSLKEPVVPCTTELSLTGFFIKGTPCDAELPMRGATITTNALPTQLTISSVQPHRKKIELMQIPGPDKMSTLSTDEGLRYILSQLNAVEEELACELEQYFDSAPASTRNGIRDGKMQQLWSDVYTLDQAAEIIRKRLENEPYNVKEAAVFGLRNTTSKNKDTLSLYWNEYQRQQQKLLQNENQNQSQKGE